MSGTHVMCHVQHLMGSGHQWRTAALSRALCARGCKVTYVSGGYALPNLDVGCAEFVQLPPARAADMGYKVLVDEHRQPVDDDWRARRRSTLIKTFEVCHPDVLLIETFPFGRRLLRFELIPLLEAAHARRPRPRVVCSVRDILENHNTPGRHEESVELVQRYFDLVLVHGDPDLVPFETTFPLAHQLQDKLCYTGYVRARVGTPDASSVGRDEVLVSVGGAAFGEHVLTAAIEAQALSTLRDRTWRILVGHNLPQDRFAHLQSQARGNLVVERNRKDFTSLLRNCALSVSQAGYNTMLEVLEAGTPAVVIPYSDEREKEQAIRARMLRDCGLVELIENEELTPRCLAQAVDRVWQRPRAARPTIKMNGASTSASLIAQSR